MRLALFEPDIPGNAGTLLRTAACLGVPVDVIEPAGFLLTDRRLRRAGMDYLERVALTRHDSWDAFLAAWKTGRETQRETGRLVLLTTRGDTAYSTFRFEGKDALVVGRESGGVPEAVHQAVDARLRVPMVSGMRSLNVVVAAAMVMGEALRQTGGFPEQRS